MEKKTESMDIAALLAENARRNAELQINYDPITGCGCYGERQPVTTAGGQWLLPVELAARADVAALTPLALDEARFECDFEYWCARCVTIKDKVSARNVPFRLNAPQRRLLAVLEDMRHAGKPIRAIVLKARQWGGSTLVQVYMAWMQIVRRTCWNSVICGHLRDTASAIQGMYTRLLRFYPRQYKPDGDALRFRPYEKSRNICEITSRQCLVVAGTAGSQESIRGMDIAMAHLTEVAFWPATPQKSPENIIRAVCGSVMLEPETLVVLESTANGMGNFFHSEWLRAKTGFSDKQAVFVPWHEIEIYRHPVKDAAALWRAMDEYEQALWQQGLTLEMIAWYHAKRREYSTHSQMQAEYPTNDIEAFAHSGQSVFSEMHLDVLRRDCRPATRCSLLPAPLGPECLSAPHFCDEPDTGQWQVWQAPVAAKGKNAAATARYVVSVDVGGLSDKADFSVITVIRRDGRRHCPEVVAQWRGHTYHDRLGWMAAQAARLYGNALLVIESNTLEMEYSEGDGTQYILNLLRRHYRNLFRRSASRAGFHTNRDTKTEAIFHLIGLIRDHAYTERSEEAVNELSYYEHKPRGGFGAVSGRHDDMVMTRAIGLLVAGRLSARNTPLPRVEELL